MNPELYNYVMEKLFKSGALDVYKVSILMKKDRLGVMLTVMCKNDTKEALKEIMFKETTTLGIREYKVERTKLIRDFKKVNTIYGDVMVKKAYFNGQLIKAKPEYEDCKRLAEKTGVPIIKIYDEVYKNIEKA